jgi:aryl-alcohol dehydrogenase-like predicted oxidoreductase
MEYGSINSLDKKISKLILGNDNQSNINSAYKLWDAFLGEGGNTFDNAFIYGNGTQEKLLGKWIKDRNLFKKIVIISKAVLVSKDLEKLSEYINISLDRLNATCIDIFLLHRDFNVIPVDEIISLLNYQKNSGKIKIFGVSNWTISRFLEANLYAEKNKLNKLSVLSNNFSLAKMVKPLWSGCISLEGENIFNILSNNNISHFSWSSQSRGFFYKKKLNLISYLCQKKYRENFKIRSYFKSVENFNRLKKVEVLAKKYGVTNNDINLAYILQQKFPSYAIFGSRNTEQLKSTLRCLNVKLNSQDIEYLSNDFLNKKSQLI